MCERKAYPERKSCAFKKIQIHVDGVKHMLKGNCHASFAVFIDQKLVKI